MLTISDRHRRSPQEAIPKKGFFLLRTGIIPLERRIIVDPAIEMLRKL